MYSEEKQEQEKMEIVTTLFGHLPDYSKHFNIFLNMKDFELTKTQLKAMLVIAREKTLSMGELADQLGIQPEQATRVIGSLAEKQLVERSIHPGNRRQIDISLTENGIDYLDSLKESYGRTLSKALDKLTFEEQQDFLTALRIVMRTLDKIFA